MKTVQESVLSADACSAEVCDCAHANFCLSYGGLRRSTVKQVVCLLGAGLNCQTLQQEIKNALTLLWPLPQDVLEKQAIEFVD